MSTTAVVAAMTFERERAADGDGDFGDARRSSRGSTRGVYGSAGDCHSGTGMALNLPPEPTALRLADQVTSFLIQGLSRRRLRLIAEYELLAEATRDDEPNTLSRSSLNIMQPS